MSALGQSHPKIKNIKATGDTIGMGQELYGQGGFTRYTNLSDYDLTDDDSLVAGQPSALGLSIQGISQAQLDTLKTRLETTKIKLQAKSTTGLTGEQITGDILSANIWSWFAMVESHGSIAQRSSGILEYPALSYGLFHASVHPVKSWGITRSVKFPGVNMDIGHVRNLIWHKKDDKSAWVAYNQMRGQYKSLMEGAIPQAFFSDPNQCNTKNDPQSTLRVTKA